MVWRAFPLLLIAVPFWAFGAEYEKDRGRPQGELDAHYRLGLGHLKRHRLNQAIQAFRRCLEIDSLHYDARVRLGETYLRQQRLDRAADVLQRAIEIASNRIEARLVFAEVLTSEGRFYESRQEIQWVLETDSEDIPVDARMKVGYLLGIAGGMLPNLQEARKQFEKVLGVNPNHVGASFQLGIVQLRLGRFSEAAERFESIIRHYPRHAEAWYQLGVAHLRNQDYLEAIPALKEALRIRPSSLETRWALKLVYDGSGGYPEDLEEKYRLKHFHRGTGKPPVLFTDVAPQAGVAKMDGGRGSAWGDYDNDGDLDLFALGHYTPQTLYRNNGRVVGRSGESTEGGCTFTDVAPQAGLAHIPGGFASLFADYDNDGDLDLYVTRDGWFGRKPNGLYRNNGRVMGPSGESTEERYTFTDVTASAGVGDAGSGFCAAWGDYDNDGDLDLYIANGVVGDASANVLYRNNGRGVGPSGESTEGECTFTDVASQAGVAHTGPAIGTAFGDYDKDGYLDLYVVNHTEPNVLYHNNGDGTFTDVSEQAGVASQGRGFVTFFLDYDNDADLDLFISTMGAFADCIQSQIDGEAGPDTYRDTPVLYRNNGDGTFTDVTIQAGLNKVFGSMGANFGDIDHDGYQDLYLANGGPEMGRLEPDALFHNNGDGTFTDITESTVVGEQIGKGHGVTFGDYDGDGDLDMYVPIGGAYIGDQWPNRLYRNEGNANNWLVIKTVGTQSNRDGIGAKVTVRAGSLSQYAEVNGGCGFGSTNSLPLEFGLGANGPVDFLEVRWPSGVVQQFENLPVNQILTVTEAWSKTK